MRKNIIVICYDYALSRRIATILAEMFDMRYFDMYDMFAFDNAPYTLTDVLKINGEDYVDKEMRGILKSELDFSGVVFVVDTKIISKNADLFGELKENNIIMFLKSDFKREFSEREHIAFKSPEEKEYFTLKLDELFEIEHFISDNIADMVLDIDNLTYRQIKDNVIEQLKTLLK